MLFERFCLFLKKVNGVGDAYAESRSLSEDGALRLAWRSFSANGTPYIGGKLARQLIGARPLTFKKKCDGVEGIEIADMLAQHALEETLIDAGLRQGFRNAASKYVRNALADKWDTRRGSKEIRVP